ncbi:LON peptidase substrate-binding domain-containing protein [Galbibacter sp. EGI 63066]|uniref:LON peptidase substrate-binding domain-containing protein n=1 Tax=Galbibacter sp. EGI 63066 TaxID=2993559 RepID=UPI002248EB38|nr:LON peptidase substrate-binding domain-containing protein [Galbibacter sp. EGI 63066]MCX2679230.1 LON peptidase substrate-binding domain-containing protein [Galbibacter sp. EGI 63066]
MSNAIPLFPLQLVVFPGERLPLHIFEERYKQLVTDCDEEKINFGIPTYIDGKMEYGTEIKLGQIVKRYENGSLDIVCMALRVFKIDKFYNRLPDKLYSGGEVSFINNVDDSTEAQRKEVIQLIYRLYKNIGVAVKYIDEESFSSFLYAHKIGMSIKDEYKLLQIMSERERLAYIKKHIKKVIPILKQINKTREIIQMNGHFKNLDPLDFNNYIL